MKRFVVAAGIAVAAFSLHASAFAQSKGPVVGVSWSNFQEERWKTDEAAIKAAIEKAGGTYLSADAQSSPAKQLTDVESLIADVVKSIDAPLIVADSIASVERVKIVCGLGIWGFTVGGAVFDRSFAGEKTLRGQIQTILDAARAASEMSLPVA